MFIDALFILALGPPMAPPATPVDTRTAPIDGLFVDGRAVYGSPDVERWAVPGGQASCTRLTLHRQDSNAVLARIPIAYDVVYRASFDDRNGPSSPSSSSGALNHRRIETRLTATEANGLLVEVSAHHRWQTFRFGKRFGSMPLEPAAGDGDRSDHSDGRASNSGDRDNAGTSARQWRLDWDQGRWQARQPLRLADGCD